MSRIRTIKPDFFLDDGLAELPPLTRLLFIGLWTLADCKGRLEDRPKKIRAQLHPYDDGDTDAMLQALHDTRFIQRYEVDGKRYLAIRTFEKHQRLTGKEAEAESNIPAPATENQQVIGETSGKDFSFTNVQEGKGKEGNRKGREEEGKGDAPALGENHFVVSGNPKPSKPTRTDKDVISADWEPSESTYVFLEAQGINRPFSTGCVAEFRLYWRERAERRPGWEAAFVNNVKRQWEHRPPPATRIGQGSDRAKGRTVLEEMLARNAAAKKRRDSQGIEEAPPLIGEIHYAQSPFQPARATFETEVLRHAC